MSKLIVYLRHTNLINNNTSSKICFDDHNMLLMIIFDKSEIEGQDLDTKQISRNLCTSVIKSYSELLS